jgi:hypothetical protein
MDVKKGIADFLKTAPAKFEKAEKKDKPKTEKIAVDRYGLRRTSKVIILNDLIAGFVDAGRKDAILPENLAKLSGIPIDRVKGHLSWFNRKNIWNDTKGDYVPVVKAAAKSLQERLAEKAVANQATIAATK